MKKILLVFFLTSITSFAQIIITGEDVQAIFEVGNGTTIKQDTLGSSVDIGIPGGNNIWDFTSLQYNIQGEYTSVDPASTPFISDFPGATFCSHLDGYSQGYDAEIWTYYSFSNFFNNHGGATTVSAFPGTVLTIKNEPPRQTYIDPMTYNSQWNETYTQTIFLNGTPFGTESVSLSVIVDAYGTMIIPGGDSVAALRIRETLTIAGITSVTYSFLAKNGEQVALFASSSNPPNSGIISVNETSFNSEFSGGGGSLDLSVTYPGSNDIVIAGEMDSIKYMFYDGDVDLYYSLDEGANFVLIDSNYNELPGVYYWDVPDSLLTTKAVIKVVDSSPDSAESGVFKIKPWQLSRIDANYNFELYEPDQDGWNYTNNGGNQWPMAWWQQFNYSGDDPITGNSYPNQAPFNTAFSSNFPDWPLFVDAYSTAQCYMDDPPSIYSTAATSRWAGKKGQWGGSCFGFSVSSIFGFYNKNFLSQYIGVFNELFDVNLNDSTRHVVNQYQIYQWGQAFQALWQVSWNKSPRQLLSDLKEMLGSDNVDARVLGFYNNNGSGGHAVVPYKLERVGNTSRFNIKLYNCNSPGSLNNFIFIDSVANTWIDSTGLNWGTGTNKCFLGLDNSDFITSPTLDKTGSSYYSNSDNSGFSRLEINNTPNAAITIISGTGEQIGYQDSMWFNNINDAIPLIPLTGGLHPPIGYNLPMDIYSLELNEFSDSVSYVSFFADSTIYNYRRSNAENNENDLFEYSENGIGITNPDQIVKYANFETIILQDTVAEKVFVATNVQISASDSVHFGEKDRNELVFKNYGDGMNYNLNVRYASANGGTNFLHMSIPMDQNSAHQIIPEWGDLQNEPVVILVDLGNDGTIDDTLSLENQVSGVGDDQGQLLSPNTYNLAQNFPNPFNPSTSIRYSIPKRSNVTLKVYDILGKEIASLVNEEKDRGVYTVSFNASSLSSGIYFYTLRADGFVQTKKMLLIK